MSQNERVIAYKIQIDDQPVKSLQAQYRAAREEAQKLATAEVVDQEALQAAIDRTAELKDQMSNVNEQVAIFASGSKYEQVSNSLGGVRKSLMSLDFGKAQERAQGLAKAARTISFGDAIQSLQQLGGTFVSLGKALLTNPLFLIAAVIAGIVYAIYKLLDSLGIIKKVMEAVGAVVKWLTDLFYSLTDAIGLTSKAEEAAARTAEINAERRRVAFEIASQSIVNDMQREIEKMKASGAAIEDIEDAEISLAETRLANFKEQMKRDLAILDIKKKHGLITNEELKKEHELNEELKQLVHDLDMTRTNVENARQGREDKRRSDDQNKAKEHAAKLAKIQEDAEKLRQQMALDTEKFIEQLRREREDIEFGYIEDEIEREKLRALAQLERRNADIDFTKMTAEARVEWEKFYQEEKERIETDAYARELERANQKALDNQARIDAEIEAEKAKAAELERIELDRIEKEQAAQLAAQYATVAATADLLNQLAGLAEEGSAQQKLFALGSILASQAEAIAKAVPIAMEASTGTGPAAPFVFASTLIGLGASIVASIAQAKQILSQAPGGQVSGGGSTPQMSVPMPQMGQAPTASTTMFNNNGGQATVGTQYNVVNVVDYTDIQNTGNRVKMLENAVSLGL